MYKAVIFDLDGLLIDSEVISYQIYQDLIQKYGYSFTIEDYVQNYCGKTAISNMTAIIERFHLPISIEEGLIFEEERENIYFEKGVDLKKGAKELLENLKQNQYQIVLASSSTKDRAMKALKQHHIDSYFDAFVFGPEVQKGKPNPDIFLKACEKINAKPNECLVLEDSEAGIQAAYQAHIPVICIPDMKEPNKEYKDKTENILSSLLDVIVYLKENSHYQLVAFDMDGTLLNSQKYITDQTINAVNKAIQKDKIVIFNTGRCLAELKEFLELIPEISYLNCISGSFVYDLKKHKTIYSKALDIQTVIKLMEIAKQEDTMIQLLTQESIVQKDKIPMMEKYHIGVYQKMYEKVTTQWEDIYKQYIENPFPVEKLNIYHTSSSARERTKQRIQEMNLEVEMANAEESSVEVNAKGIHKGIGLEKLCEYLNIPLSQTIVVGDADDDIEVLKKAGLAVAMGNANEKIKQLSDVIVSDNDHDGCVEVIEKYLIKL